MSGPLSFLKIAPWIALAMWLVAALAISTRLFFLLLYDCFATVTPILEPIAFPISIFVVVSILGTLAGVAIHRADATETNLVRRATLLIFLAALPTCLLSFLRHQGWRSAGPFFLEPILLASFSGGAAHYLAPIWVRLLGKTRFFANNRSAIFGRSGLLGGTATLVTAMLLALFWYFQSLELHNDFRLGFNDFGHFSWRLANSWNGRGWLVESPVLPRFWDHFNPGLSLFVPLWGLWPSERMIFALHAISIASCAPILYAIARKLGHQSAAAFGWSIVWLLHPVVSQLNVAYTYGWHPITLGLPCIFATLLALLYRRYFFAALLAIAAMSMEEGWLVVLSLICLTIGALGWLRMQRVSGALQQEHDLISSLMHPYRWIACGVVIAVGFVLVYKFSGLAEFQTGRFVRLGNNLGEVILSPVLRPTAFWGQIFRFRSLLFIAGIFVPWHLPYLIRNWRWIIPTAPPLLVLLAWDHLPATSIAFHYSTSFLPLLWLAAASSKDKSSQPVAPWAPLFGSLILSLYLGAHPWSNPTLGEVRMMTYGVEETRERRAENSDGKWIHQQLQTLSEQPGTRVLATGRLASHLLRCDDLETVGQFLERRPRLAELYGLKDPLLHFNAIILDRREGFQQSAEQIAQIEAEAMRAGYKIIADQHDVIVLQSPSLQTPPTQTRDARP